MVEQSESKQERKEEVVARSETLRLPKDTAATLAYGTGFLPMLGWITGLLMLFLERDKYVRFHSLQAVAVFGAGDVLRLILNKSAIFGKLSSVVYLVQFCVWLLLMYRTYNGEPMVLPFFGKWARKQVVEGKDDLDMEGQRPKRDVEVDPETDKQMGV